MIFPLVSYEEGKAKLDAATVLSDIGSADEETMKKRRRALAKKHGDESSDDDVVRTNKIASKKTRNETSTKNIENNQVYPKFPDFEVAVQSATPMASTSCIQKPSEISPDILQKSTFDLLVKVYHQNQKLDTKLNKIINGQEELTMRLDSLCKLENTSDKSGVGEVILVDFPINSLEKLYAVEHEISNNVDYRKTVVSYNIIVYDLAHKLYTQLV